MAIKTRKTTNEQFIEKILGRKFVRPDLCYYLVKWVDKPDAENTWEPEVNLSCPELIAEFERRLREEAEEDAPPPVPRKALKPVEILAASSAHGKDYYLIKMKEGGSMIASAGEAVRMCPMLLYKHLQETGKAAKPKN